MVKRFRKYQASLTSAPDAQCAQVSSQQNASQQQTSPQSASSLVNAQQSWRAPVSKHSPPHLIPAHMLPERMCRLSEPPARVDDKGKGIGKSRPIYPRTDAGAPIKAPSVNQQRTAFDPPPHRLGHPVPPLRPTPRSLSMPRLDERPSPVKRPHWSIKEEWAEPDLQHRTYPEVHLPSEAPAIRPSTSQEQSQQRRSKCTHTFLSCLHRCSQVCTLFQTLQQSRHSASHVEQLLANFSPNTLERYLKAVQSFLDFHTADGHCSLNVPPGTLADFLFAAQRSVHQDRAVHGTSPIIAVKALRLWAKHCTCQELTAAMHSPLVNAHSKDTQCRDTRECIPRSL